MADLQALLVEDEGPELSGACFGSREHASGG
jgi:hypothetical protein